MSRSILASVFGSLFAIFAFVAPAEAVTCDRWASTHGTDSAAGLEAAPVRSLERLVDVLEPGQTGCLRAGTYRHAGSVNIYTPRITVTSAPGERAKIRGRLYVAPPARGVTFAHVDLDGRNDGAMPSPTVYGDDATFSDVDLTNRHTAICFNVGSYKPGYKVVTSGLVIENSRIHHCGKMPAANHDHGIYLENTRGARIVGNAIYDNADRAINLYPRAVGTVIRRNVMDGNGEGILFAGDFGTASDRNIVENNVLANGRIRAVVESWFPSGQRRGRGNLVRNNCIAGQRTIAPEGGGFRVSSTNRILGDPLFVDRGSKDFRLRAASPCAAVIGAAKPQAPSGPALDGAVPALVGAVVGRL